MNARLALAAAKEFLIQAANEMVEPVPPEIGKKFASAVVALGDLIALVDPPVSATPISSCPHGPVACKACLQNACFN